MWGISLIIKENLIKVNTFHCHKECLDLIIRFIAKDIIKKKESSKNCFTLKLRKIYDKIKNNISDPEYMSKNKDRQSGLYLKLNKQIHKNINELSEIDVESGYFKALYGEKFAISKMLIC